MEALDPQSKGSLPARRPPNVSDEAWSAVCPACTGLSEITCTFNQAPGGLKPTRCFRLSLTKYGGSSWTRPLMLMHIELSKVSIVINQNFLFQIL